MTALWLCSRWTWEICIFYCFGLESSIYLSVYSPRLGRFSAIISSNAFSIPFSLFSFQDIPIRQMMVCLMMSLKSLKTYIYMFFSFFFLTVALTGEPHWPCLQVHYYFFQFNYYIPLVGSFYLIVIFSIFLMSCSVFIHFSLGFIKHLCDHYFELFIR